jgi:hypothetical protein
MSAANSPSLAAQMFAASFATGRPDTCRGLGFDDLSNLFRRCLGLISTTCPKNVRRKLRDGPPRHLRGQGVHCNHTCLGIGLQLGGLWGASQNPPPPVGNLPFDKLPRYRVPFSYDIPQRPTGRLTADLRKTGLERQPAPGHTRSTAIVQGSWCSHLLASSHHPPLPLPLPLPKLVAEPGGLHHEWPESMSEYANCAVTPT